MRRLLFLFSAAALVMLCGAQNVSMAQVSTPAPEAWQPAAEPLPSPQPVAAPAAEEPRQYVKETILQKVVSIQRVAVKTVCVPDGEEKVCVTQYVCSPVESTCWDPYRGCYVTTRSYVSQPQSYYVTRTKYKSVTIYEDRKVVTYEPVTQWREIETVRR